ncbi:MAG: glutaredoxin 3 [Wigglesworthia glossinidia]|nr:glutaredoxin 3 [Wigglesworthia glossinidia]
MYNKAKIYLKKSCPYCEKAKLLLKKYNIIYEKIFVEKNNHDFLKMIQKSGRKTVPQVFINEKHIGGYDDLKLFLKEK